MTRKYAQVSYQQVVKIIDVINPIVEPQTEQCSWIDITNLDPQPTVGWKYTANLGLFAPVTEEFILFSEAKKLARFDIDTAAGRARSKFVTDIPGQSEVYREKYEQALDFLSSTTQVDYHDYPLLHLEAQILQLPVKRIAEIIVKRRSNWITKISAIESLRLHGKHNIELCTNVKEVQKLSGHIIHQLDNLN